jgi:5-methylcytosine-specific restriction protein A
VSWSKESSTSRGYDYAWQKLRLAVLERDFYLCQPCKKVGRITEAKQVDHIINKAECKKRGLNTDFLDNLQSICVDCHKLKTQKESGKFGEPKPVIGADGWPK